MSLIPISMLKSPRKICTCACCGTSHLVIERTEMIGYVEYIVGHRGYCKQPYWYTKGFRTVNQAVKAWNDKNEEWQDGFDLVWFTVDQVYETRWDCMDVAA